MAEPDVTALLVAYERLLRHTWGSPAVRRASRWRAAVGVNSFVISRVRTVIDVLDRRFSLRAALGHGDASADLENASRLRQFASSLPPRRSPLRLVLLAALVLVVAQLVLALLGHLGGGAPAIGGDSTKLEEELNKLADLNPANAGEAVRVFLHADFFIATLVLVVVCLSAYLVLRPLANGVVVARALYDPTATRGRLAKIPALGVVAEGVANTERELFVEIDMQSPSDSMLDIAVPVLLAVAALLVAAVVWVGYVHGVETESGVGGSETSSQSWVTIAQPREYLVIALLLGCAAAARLGALGYRFRSRGPVLRADLVAYSSHPGAAARTARRVGRVGAGGLAVGLVMALFLLYAAPDRKRPSLELSTNVLTGRVLAKGTLPVSLRCDEPCQLIGGEVVTPAAPRLDLSVLRSNLDSSEGFRRAWDVGFGLSGEQQASLRRWYRHTRCPPTVRIEVADPADHRTALDLGLAPGLTTRAC